MCSPFARQLGSRAIFYSFVARWKQESTWPVFCLLLWVKLLCFVADLVNKYIKSSGPHKTYFDKRLLLLLLLLGNSRSHKTLYVDKQLREKSFRDPRHKPSTLTNDPHWDMGSEHGRCWNKLFLHVYYREKACILCKVSWPVLIQTYIYYGS